MNLIANTGIQFFTIPFEIDLDNNFKMFFHEWLDSKDNQLKLEIAHYFAEDEVWVKKFDLSDLGYAMQRNDYRITESWETIAKDDEFNRNSIINIDTEDPKDSGCFPIGTTKRDRRYFNPSSPITLKKSIYFI